MGVKLLWLDILQVAGKDDHIGLLGVDAVDGALQQPAVMLLVTAYMGIREEHDAITVECLGQVFGYVVCMIDFQLVESHERTPEEDKPYDRNR